MRHVGATSQPCRRTFQVYGALMGEVGRHVWPKLVETPVAAEKLIEGRVEREDGAVSQGGLGEEATLAVLCAGERLVQRAREIAWQHPQGSRWQAAITATPLRCRCYRADLSLDLPAHQGGGASQSSQIARPQHQGVCAICDTPCEPSSSLTSTAQPAAAASEVPGPAGIERQMKWHGKQQSAPNEATSIMGFSSTHRGCGMDKVHRT